MVSELAAQILEQLPTDGSKLGHTSLTRKLGLDIEHDAYWDAVTELEEAGQIRRGRGRGGSLGRSVAQTEAEEEEEAEELGGVESEADLYAPLKAWFDASWGKDYQAPDVYGCVITGSPAGHKRTSGKWSRPDLAIVTVSSVDFFIPKRSLELTTVEVKRYADFGLAAVFEAAAHSRIAHQSYLAVEWLGERDLDQEEGETERVVSEARRFKLGVLQVRLEGGKADVKVILEPDRLNPDPKLCSDYIDQHFEPFHRQLRNAVG